MMGSFMAPGRKAGQPAGVTRMSLTQIMKSGLAGDIQGTRGRRALVHISRLSVGKYEKDPRLDHLRARDEAVSGRHGRCGQPQPGDPRRADHGAGGPERGRQDHNAPDDQQADRPDRREDPARRPGHPGVQAGHPAPRHRLCHPAGRAVPAPDRRGQHRHRAAAGRMGQAEGPPARPRADGPGRAGRGAGGPVPEPAVRRAAAAGRRGPGARRRPAGAADGRAVQRGRPDCPGLAAR